MKKRVLGLAAAALSVVALSAAAEAKQKGWNNEAYLLIDRLLDGTRNGDGGCCCGGTSCPCCGGSGTGGRAERPESENRRDAGAGPQHGHARP